MPPKDKSDNRPSRLAGRRKSSVIVLAVPALLVGGIAGAAVENVHYHHKMDVVAAVNGVVITQKAYDSRLETAAGDAVIRQIADEDLQLDYAAKKGCAPTDAEVNAFYDEASKRPRFSEGLASTGQTPDDFKRAIRIKLGEAKVLCKGVTISESDLRSFYQQNTDPKNPSARYYTPDYAKVDLIMTANEADAGRALSAVNSGLTFDSVARSFSKHPSAASGGIVEVLRGRSDLPRVPALQDAIFSMKYGQQIGPQQFGGAWWIIRCLDTKKPVTESFDSVKQDCRLQVMFLKGVKANGAKVAADFAKFRKSVPIDVVWPQYKTTLKQS